MRTTPVKDIEIEAHDDPRAAGQVVARLKGVRDIDAGSRFRLRLVDQPLGDARWPDAAHQPVDVCHTADGVDVTIGADLANHAMLAPGTIVLMEIGNVRGEFSWPAVTPVQQPKRKRVAQRNVAAPPVVLIRPDTAAHVVSAAMLDFDLAATAPERAVENAPATMPPPVLPTARAAQSMEPVAIAVSPVAPDKTAPTVVPVLAHFRRVSELPTTALLASEQPASETIPSIFRSEEWPSAKPAHDPQLVSMDVRSTQAETPFEVPGHTAVSDVFPATSAPSVAPSFDSPQRRAPVPEPILPQSQQDASPAPAAETVRQKPFARSPAWRSAMTRLDRLSALAAAAIGFTVLSAIATAAMFWPTGRGKADARGVAFQDQRRWQDGQVQKSVVVKAPALLEPPSKPTSKPTPPMPTVAAATVAPPVVCGGAEPRATALPAGMMSIALRSACHRQQAVTVSYGGLEFKSRFDVDGGVDVTIDCIFGNSVPVLVTFADGKRVSWPASCLELDRVSKIGIIWHQPIDLDLHVFERPAAPGGIGHINGARPGVRDTARDLASTERAARGFLSSIGSAKLYDGADGVRMTVYTAFHPPQATTQTIPVAVDFASRGDTAAGETCLGGRLASPSYEVVRLTARGQVTREDGQFAAFACGTSVATTLRFNQSLHAPLRIRN